MNDLSIRAAALRLLLESEPNGASDPAALNEAIASCSDELVTMGEPRTALELIEQARNRLSKDNELFPIRLMLVESRALRVAGRLMESLERARIVLATSSIMLPSMTHELAMARVLEGAALWRLNRVEEAIPLLRNVRAELLSKPDSSLTASCSFELSSALLFAGKQAESKAFALEALVSARRTSSTMFEGLALQNLHRLDKDACRWSSAIESGELGLKVLDNAGHRVSAAISKMGLGVVAWKVGRLDSALEFSSQASRVFEEIAADFHKATATLLRALVLLHRGNYLAARSASAEHLHDPDSRVPLLSTEYLGDVHLEQGEASEALALYEQAWPQAFALVPKGDIVAELRRRKAECFLLLGRINEARDEGLAALKHCRELGDRYEEAATLRILALTFAALGKPAEAKSWFEQGFAMYEDIETPYEWGKLWMSYGDWLAGPNAGTYADASAALEAYRIAVEHFERMGAEAKRGEAEARIRRMQPDEIVFDAPKLDAIDAHKRPARRPRMQSELERRSAWARETFDIVTRNRGILGLLDECAKLASTNSPILILGESGCGKELVAAGVHRLSARTGPYMPLNCTTIPREVFESELFGHLAGSFTGATKDKLGIFEACDGGTVFLDEIAEMPVELQARLLRFLESGEFRRVGATKNTQADTRVIAATNRERGELRRGERFRPDLYYRLAHGVVTLPPLRQRGEDIGLLIDHFMDHYNREQRRQAVLSTEAMQRLLAYTWPGNIRELRSVIRRAVVFSTPGVPVPVEQLDLDASHIPSNLMEETIQVEKQRIEQVLKQTHGVKSEAARILGLSRTTLISKMKRYGLMD